MAKIKKIVAREILDSRGWPTIEAMVQLADQSLGVYSTPAGASVGKHEAKELRDGDENRYQGRGVLKALENIVTILAPALIGQEAASQDKIDSILSSTDGSEDKSKLGANTLLALSCAIAKAEALSEKMTLYQYVAKLAKLDTKQFTIPTPMFNLINGGKHGGGNLDFQEFLVVPPKANSYSDNLKLGVEIYYSLKDTLKAHSALTIVGDEGGYAPILYSNTDALKIIQEAVGKAGYNVGLNAFFSLDAAATNFKDGSSYKIKDKPISLSPQDLIDFYNSLNEQFHLLSIEDPLAEDDFDDWATLMQNLGNETLIVADDLTCTNLERLKKAISEKACNAMVIKPNQIGTLTETLKVAEHARKANFKLIVSHRSGETNDEFIADFAVGIGSDYVKLGAPARGERVAKYNRLLEIEHDLS